MRIMGLAGEVRLCLHLGDNATYGLTVLLRYGDVEACVDVGKEKAGVRLNYTGWRHGRVLSPAQITDSGRGRRNSRNRRIRKRTELSPEEKDRRTALLIGAK